MKSFLNVFCATVILTFVSVQVKAHPFSALKFLKKIDPIVGVGKNLKLLNRLPEENKTTNNVLSCFVKNKNNTLSKNCEGGKFIWNKENKQCDCIKGD